jgi:anti-sigma B factor antagonist
MQLSERRIGDVTILDLEGKLTLTDQPGKLKEKIASLIFQGEQQIVLNLGELSFVDSSGLGELVACHTTAWRGGATVRLANAGRRLQDLLVLTKLLTIFDSYDSEHEALASFEPQKTQKTQKPQNPQKTQNPHTPIETHRSHGRHGNVSDLSEHQGNAYAHAPSASR